MGLSEGVAAALGRVEHVLEVLALALLDGREVLLMVAHAVGSRYLLRQLAVQVRYHMQRPQLLALVDLRAHLEGLLVQHSERSVRRGWLGPGFPEVERALEAVQGVVGRVLLGVAVGLALRALGLDQILLMIP